MQLDPAAIAQLMGDPKAAALQQKFMAQFAKVQKQEGAEMAFFMDSDAGDVFSVTQRATARVNAYVAEGYLIEGVPQITPVPNAPNQWMVLIYYWKQKE